MQQFENVLVERHAPQCLIEQLIKDEYFDLNLNPKLQPMTTTNLSEIPNAIQPTKPYIKSYELVNQTIQESYFEIEGMENSDEFISDFANSHPHGVILVVNDNNPESDYLNKILGNKLTHTIVCKSATATQNIDPNAKTEVDSIRHAAKAAYNIAKDGQAILFQGVDQRFDFISHIF